MRRETPGDQSSAAIDTVSERVIEGIADRERISPLEVSPPLFDVIDADALDRLYADGRSGATVAFAYAGYRVTVSGEGDIDLTPLTNA